MNKVFNRYLDVVQDLPIEDNDKLPYAKELTRRHSSGWRFPPKFYIKYKESLFYKDSLERNSPYYVDLLKITDRDTLNTVLLNLYKHIRIHPSSYN